MKYLLEAVGVIKPRVGVVGMLAEFKNPGDLLKAADKVKDQGFAQFDCHSPFPIHGMDGAMGMKPSILGWIVAFFGLCGLSGAMLLQWWTRAVDYPLIISGKEYAAWWAFVPVAFELTILFSAFATVFGMFALNQLPRFHHPVFYSENFARHSDDGFFISVEADDALFHPEKTADFFKSIGASNVELLTAND